LSVSLTYNMNRGEACVKSAWNTLAQEIQFNLLLTCILQPERTLLPNVQPRSCLCVTDHLLIKRFTYLLTTNCYSFINLEMVVGGVNPIFWDFSSSADPKPLGLQNQ